jgi:hypothetical protein
MRYYNNFEMGKGGEKEKWEVYFPARRDKRQVYLNENNKIWLEERRKLPLEKRIKPYRWLGIGNQLRKNREWRLDRLDLHFLDPLTGIMNQDYLNVFPNKRWDKNVMLYIDNGCMGKVNEEISMKAEDVLLHAASYILKDIKEIIARFYYGGLYFMVFDADYDSIIKAKMKLARTTIFLSNGYQIKGLGLQLRDRKDCPYSYPLTKIWGNVAKTEIFKAAQITKTLKWANVFVCSKFYRRIEGKFIDLINNGYSF